MGFVAAEDVHAVEPFPPFRASIKDGYAVIAADGIGARKMISSALAGFDVRVIKSNNINRLLRNKR